MDNAIFHKGGRIQQLIQDAGGQLLYLPPYSPDINKIEKCWLWLKSRIGHQLTHFDCLPEAIENVLRLVSGAAGRGCYNIAVLSLTGLIAEALTKVGLEDLLTAINCQRRKSRPHSKLLEEIEKLSLFDGDIKERLQMTVTEGCGCATATILTNMDDIAGSAVTILQAVPGMSPAHHRDFKSSHPIMRRAGWDGG